MIIIQNVAKIKEKVHSVCLRKGLHPKVCRCRKGKVIKMKINDFFAYIEEQVADCAKKERALIAENRKDEANMERIKSNVYGIAKSLCQMTEELAKKHGVDHATMFVDKLTAVMAPWKASLTAAKEHTDSEKECIELIKLETADKILEAWKR